MEWVEDIEATYDYRLIEEQIAAIEKTTNLAFPKYLDLYLTSHGQKPTYFKRRQEYYTEEELMVFLEKSSTNTQNPHSKEREEYVNRSVKHFEIITGHPEKSDVLFYPEEGREDTSEGFLKK